MKRSKRIVNCTKNMLKVPAKEVVQSIQQIKQDKVIDNDLQVSRSTPTWFTFELDGNTFFQQVRLHPRTGSTTIGSRIKVGIYFLFKSIKHRRTCCRSDSDSLFLCSTHCYFACRKLSIHRQSTVCVSRFTSHTASTFFHVQMCTVCPHITHDVTRSRVAQV